MSEISGMIQQFLEGNIKTLSAEPMIESKTITENGTYTAPEGVDGYSPVVVNVPSDAPVIESKTITENGTYTPESGVDGYSPVIVNVPPTEPVIESKNISENGTYTAPEGVDGYSPVVVNVPPTEPVIESKTITENGTYTPESGVDGFAPVVVNVQSTAPVIESKNITENGTYTAPEGVNGYSPVIVNVPLPENAYLLKSVANLPQAIASFSDGAVAPMMSLKVAIEPQQEGSGDPSPTNVRPISGWDKVNVTVADATTDPTVENIYTIDLDGTRYGGEVDVVNGIMTVDRVYKQVKDFEWQTQGGYYGRFYTTPSGADKALYDTNKTLIISDTYKGYSDTDKPTITNGVYIGSGGSIKVWDSEYTEATDIDVWETARANVELCYYLATPLTIQLTPTAVKSLLGQNNVWADTGDITDAEYFSKEV